MKKTKTKVDLQTDKENKGFCHLMTERIEHFEKLGKKKTADNYACALRHFIYFRGGKEIAIEDLSIGEMKDFQSYLIRKGIKMNTISLYNRELRAVYHYALDEEIIHTDRHPFRKSFTGKEKTRKRAINSNIVKRLTFLSLTDKQRLEFSRDLFLFSIYMQGMSFVDIAHLKKNQIKNGWVTYQRRKTNRQLKVKIHPQAQVIIDKYHINDSDCPYLFPILYNSSKKKWRKYSSALRIYNKHLNRLSVLLKLDEPLTSYVSRHTWASLARQCGTNDMVICEAMGHSNVEITTIYLASLDTEIVAMANLQIITSLLEKKRNS